MGILNFSMPKNRFVSLNGFKIKNKKTTENPLIVVFSCFKAANGSFTLS